MLRKFQIGDRVKFTGGVGMGIGEIMSFYKSFYNEQEHYYNVCVNGELYTKAEWNLKLISRDWGDGE